MSNIIRRRPSNASIGKSPTPAQKLINTSNKLGLSGIQNQQGTAVNIFDTVLLTTNSNRQTLNFFANTSNKSRSFSNFQNGMFTAGESMAFQFASFYLVELSASDLTQGSTAIMAMKPFSQLITDDIQYEAAPMLGLMNISVANSVVLKDFLCYEQNPNFNPRTTGISIGAVIQGSDDAIVPAYPVTGQNTIPLPTDLVLPPNQKLQVTYEIPACGTVTGNKAIVCVLGRFGSIFAPKTTL